MLPHSFPFRAATLTHKDEAVVPRPHVRWGFMVHNESSVTAAAFAASCNSRVSSLALAVLIVPHRIVYLELLDHEGNLGRLHRWQARNISTFDANYFLEISTSAHSIQFHFDEKSSRGPSHASP